MLQNARLVGCCADLVEVRSQASHRAIVTILIKARSEGDVSRIRCINRTHLPNGTDLAIIQANAACSLPVISTRSRAFTVGEVRGAATGRRTRRILIADFSPRTDSVLFSSICFLQLHVGSNIRIEGL